MCACVCIFSEIIMKYNLTVLDKRIVHLSPFSSSKKSHQHFLPPNLQDRHRALRTQV